MAEHTLKVPAEHVELFRLGANTEIGESAKWVRSSQEELGRGLLTGERDAEATADVRGALDYLNQEVALLDQLCAEDGAAEVTAASSPLAHTAEAAARIAVSQLSAALDVTPLDKRCVEEVGRPIAQLQWALELAVKYHAITEAEMQAEKAKAEAA